MGKNDDILALFVRAANKHDFSLDITLNVHGSLVSGKTISAHNYLKSLAESFEGGNDVAEKLGQQLSNASESAKSQDQEDVSFVHLKDTQIYNGDSEPTPSEEKFLWRGKIEEVEGYFLGRISAGKNK